jgi:hypothetical protein
MEATMRAGASVAAEPHVVVIWDMVSLTLAVAFLAVLVTVVGVGLRQSL